MKKLLGTLLILGATIMVLSAQTPSEVAFVEEAETVYGKAVARAGSEAAVPSMRRAGFSGGPAALSEYIAENLRYPEIALENAVEGEVIVHFHVDRKGRISDVEIRQGLDAACNREVIRMVEAMPRWEPARQGGMAVSNPVTLAVRFKLY